MQGLCACSVQRQRPEYPGWDRHGRGGDLCGAAAVAGQLVGIPAGHHQGLALLMIQIDVGKLAVFRFITDIVQDLFNGKLARS